MKQFLLIISFFVIATHGLAVEYTSMSDSVIKVVKQQADYQNKIKILRKSILEHYTTDYENTMILARYGLQLAEKKSDVQNRGEFLRSIGVSFSKQGALDSATIYYYQALSVLDKTKYYKELGQLNDDIARLYRKLNQPKRALEFYDKALSAYEKEKDKEGIARILNESGVIYQDIGDLETAYERFYKSLKIQENRKDSLGMSYSYEFLAQNMMLKNEDIKAQKYLEDALAIRLKVNHKFSIMLTYTSLGELYQKMKLYDLSNSYFKKSNEMAKKINFLDIQEYNLLQLQENFEKLDDYRNAYEYLKAHNIIKDSLYNIEKINAVEEISTKYKTVENERTILEQRAKLAEGRIYIVALIFLILLIITIVYFYVLKQRFKHQQFKKEAELNEARLKLEATKRLQDERMRISRDLHDNIGAQLAFIISAIDNLSFGIQDKESPVNHKLGTIKAFLSGTIGELRDTIWAMNLTNVTIENLKARIANYANNARQFHEKTIINLNISDAIPNDIEFTNLQGLNIYRIIQEAVNNSLKYAKASQIDVIVKSDTNSRLLNIAIIDNGSGFDKNEVELGNGLNNMHKRAMELGDELLMTSALNQGTKISFNVKF